MRGRTYEDAGVSLATAESVVERLRAAVESTRTEGVVGGHGGFAGLFALDEQRLLAASTDGVGSKLVLSRRAGRLRDAGRDLAAHCIDDVLTTGAEPLFFLDYVAAHRLDLDEVAELVEGAAEVCREAGCALLGGETAELPGIYREEELDFAGTCIGLVERVRLIDGSRCEAGDLVLGLPSSGLHTNGFSLVRRLVGERQADAAALVAAVHPALVKASAQVLPETLAGALLLAWLAARGAGVAGALAGAAYLARPEGVLLLPLGLWRLRRARLGALVRYAGVAVAVMAPAWRSSCRPSG